jgi:hypothetical protein
MHKQTHPVQVTPTFLICSAPKMILSSVWIFRSSSARRNVRDCNIHQSQKQLNTSQPHARCPRSRSCAVPVSRCELVCDSGWKHTQDTLAVSSMAAQQHNQGCVRQRKQTAPESQPAPHSLTESRLKHTRGLNAADMADARRQCQVESFDLPKLCGNKPKRERNYENGLIMDLSCATRCTGGYIELKSLCVDMDKAFFHEWA